MLVCPPRFELSEIKDLIKYLPFKNIKLIDDLAGIEEDYSQVPKEEHTSKSLKFKIGLFTSGTVEQNKKIVLYTENNFRASTKAIYDLFENSDNIFCYPQPYHIFGLSLGYAYTLFENKNLIFPEGRYSQKTHDLWLKSAAMHKDLVTLGTPTHFKDLRAHTKSVKTVSPTYSCIIGGAKVDKQIWLDVQESLKIKAPSIGYGCTEASPGLFHLPPGEEPKEDGSVGFPLKGVELFFKEDGTFSFKGENLSPAWVDSRGVHYCEELDVLDILEKKESGSYVCSGRLQEVINRGGEKFLPQELESLFLTEQSLATVCLKKPCERLGEDIFLLVEGEEERKTVENIRAVFFNKFKRGLSENNISFTQVLPLNDSHKIDRKKCLDLIQKKK